MNECLYEYITTTNVKTSDADDDIEFILEDASPDNNINMEYNGNNNDDKNIPTTKDDDNVTSTNEYNSDNNDDANNNERVHLLDYRSGLYLYYMKEVQLLCYNLQDVLYDVKKVQLRNDSILYKHIYYIVNDCVCDRDRDYGMREIHMKMILMLMLEQENDIWYSHLVHHKRELYVYNIIQWFYNIQVWRNNI